MKKTNFLFNFQEYVDELRQDDAQKEMVEQYESCFGSSEGVDFEDTPFYKDYLSKFKIPDGFLSRLKVPDDLAEDFDYSLLLRVVASSFSSDYDFKYDAETDKVILSIAVTSEGRSIEKTLDSLWSFQILRLYQIYTCEQMNLAMLTQDSEDEKHAIESERVVKLAKFNKKLDYIQRVRNLAADLEELKKGLLEKLVS